MKRMHIYLPMIRLSIHHVEVAGNGTEGHGSSLASWYHFCRQCQELHCSELCPNGSRRDGIDSGVKPSDLINMSIWYEAFSNGPFRRAARVRSSTYHNVYKCWSGGRVTSQRCPSGLVNKLQEGSP
jgi:hypothetical protein